VIEVLRERLQAALKSATERTDEQAAATLRLVLAAVRERDHCARAAGASEGVSDAEIEALLREMVAQRTEQISRCESQARLDEVEQESAEIRILESFLPPKLGESETRAAVEEAIRAVGAAKLKDTGKVIAWLKQRHNGRMDFALARRLLCERLH
jgi:uncharacterized protein YqeY